MRFAVGTTTTLQLQSVVLLLAAITPVTHVESRFLPLFDNFMLFPRIRCLLAFLRLDFSIGSFDKYNDYFRNESLVVLAQTGEYIGPEKIEEYVKFAFEDYSPFFGTGGEHLSSESFVQYKDGQCEYIALYYSNYTGDTATATNLPSTYGVSNMIKIFLDYRKRYITRMNVFFTDDFLRIFFNSIANSVETRQYVCGVMEGPCSTILNIPPGTCNTTFVALPTTTGTNSYADGNSQGCRAVHSVFANTNPINHCPHLSFTPMEDPNGNIKCQTSKFIQTSDLFTPKDMEIFEEFNKAQGLDPIIGHTLVGY